MNYRVLTLGILAFVTLGAGTISNLGGVSEDILVKSNTTEKVIEDHTVEEAIIEETFDMKVDRLYADLQTGTYQAPPEAVFAKAMKGYEKLKEQGAIKNNKLTIVDFSVSSSKERLWVIDMDTNQVLLQSLVAHGRKTGDEYATTFSNRLNSHMSSLGFYTTGETYLGRNGFSMRLDGKEKGINDNARVRAIVIHGADYAHPNLVAKQGRLGRSYGCPAVPEALNRELIELIKDGSCLFIYHTDPSYTVKSSFV